MIAKIATLRNEYQKRQGNVGNVRKSVFVFTNFLADNYGTLSGDDEENNGELE